MGPWKATAAVNLKRLRIECAGVPLCGGPFHREIQAQPFRPEILRRPDGFVAYSRMWWKHITTKDDPGLDWKWHFIQRKTSLRTTWKLRLLALGFVAFVVWVTRSVWSVQVGRSLVCSEQIGHSDGLLLDNFDPDYLVFARSAALQKDGVADKVFVPVQVSDDPEMPPSVSEGITELIAREAHVPKIERIPIQINEPVTLNAANQIRDFLTGDHVKSVVLVSPAFRSRRSFLIYNAVLRPAGIQVGCAPVFGITTVHNWMKTWHGMQSVALQFFKLQYYRFYVLP